MTQRITPDGDRMAAPRPNCPFCAAPWTDAMLEHLDAITGPASCSCCVGAHWPIEDPDPPPPPDTSLGDLCCAACGQAIYRKV